MKTEIKNALEEINNRLEHIEEQICKLKDGVVEITQAEQRYNFNKLYQC